MQICKLQPWLQKKSSKGWLRAEPHGQQLCFQPTQPNPTDSAQSSAKQDQDIQSLTEKNEIQI